MRAVLRDSSRQAPGGVQALRAGVPAPRSGQAALEFALLYSAVILPLTFMVVFVAEMLWTWHSVVDFTRAGAQFAATHCWEPDGSGSNVVNWMEGHVPRMMDQDQFQNNAAGMQVQYFTQAADGTLTALSSCADGGAICEPDVVSVSVTSYQFTRFSSFFKLGAVLMPPFTTTIPMESGGYQDATGVPVCDATQ
jgi:hypothetical protein